MKPVFICLAAGIAIALTLDYLEYRDYRRRREALWEQEEEAWLY